MGGVDANISCADVATGTIQLMSRAARRVTCLALLLLLAGTMGWAQIQTAQTDARQAFLKRLVAAAIERTNHTVRYDPAYVRIPYPGGD
ncbi:MAG: hypothetical protein ACRD36_00120, partial [Candidatus Acidiferrum sp.]